MDTNGQVTQQLEKPVEEQGTEISVETGIPSRSDIKSNTIPTQQKTRPSTK